MLLEELPGWLRERGLATRPAPGDLPGEPALVTGISMGGAGAFVYARERMRLRRPVRAVSAVSPGLFTDWRVASRRPFAGRRDWEAHDPLRFFPELAGVPTGVWCGDRDPFVDATRRYIALARPEVGGGEPGTPRRRLLRARAPGHGDVPGRHARDRVAGAADRGVG